VGCGTGELLEMGSRNFASASGCDPSAKMLQASGCKNISLQEDPRRLPYGDATFDLVTAVCVYHHVPLEDRRALGDEIRRVLKPGGRFCIFEHNPWNPATRIIVSRTPVDQNAILLSINEAIRTLQLSAFTRVASRFFLYLPEPIFRLAPALENALGGLPLGGQFAVLFHRGR
jgi:SAM-dependent methyltransferase